MSRQSSREPTGKQLEVLRYITEHVEEHGYQPTQGEVAGHFGVTRAAIQARLRGLSRKGLVEVPPGKKERAVVLKRLKFRAYTDGNGE